MVEGLMYKLRMMGTAIVGATSVVCDNAKFVHNSSNNLESTTLKKKHNAIT